MISKYPQIHNYINNADDNIMIAKSFPDSRTHACYNYMIYINNCVNSYVAKEFMYVNIKVKYESSCHYKARNSYDAMFSGDSRSDDGGDSKD